ncbi:MAG: hypothetical protein WC898_02700 [Candidatus Paceibacterota bacterium]|jgi:hypothetical protein
MKTKNYFGYLLIFTLSFLFGINPLFAQNNASNSVKMNNQEATQTKAGVKANTTKESITEELKAKREALRIEAEARKAEIQAKVVENTENKIQTRNEVRNRIFSSFATMIENLSQINERIKSRIQKMKDDGISSSYAEEMITNAENQLLISINSTEEVNTKIDENATIEEIRKSIESTKSSLKEAHGYLLKAVNELKLQLAKEREEKTNSIIDVNVTGEVSE